MQHLRRCLYIGALFSSLMTNAQPLFGTPSVGPHQCTATGFDSKQNQFTLYIDAGHQPTDALALISARKECLELQKKDSEGNSFNCEQIQCREVNQ